MRLPRSVPERSFAGRTGCPAATLYAVVRSSWACAATASVACVAPFTTAGRPKPTSAVPGDTPRSPLRTDGPVLVAVEPASTTNGVGVPSSTGPAWATAGAAMHASPIARTAHGRVPPLRRGGMNMNHDLTDGRAAPTTVPLVATDRRSEDQRGWHDFCSPADSVSESRGFADAPCDGGA